MRVTQPNKAGRPATVAALLEAGERTRVLAWAICALRERRISKAQSAELTRCAAAFTQLANVQMEYARAVEERRPVYTGPLPSLTGLLGLLERALVEAALRESERLRAELAPILADARRRLHAARG